MILRDSSSFSSHLIVFVTSAYVELYTQDLVKFGAIFKMAGLALASRRSFIKQLLDEVEHDIMNYQNRGLCYLPKPKAEADNTDKRF